MAYFSGGRNGFEDLDYLSPDFDLNSLTIPRLRSILVSHDVPYPASAKKAQLIQILQDEVMPHARRLLREREQVRRTSAGIMDMGSRETSVASDFDSRRDADRESMPPPPTPSTVSTTSGTRRGRSARSTRASTADTEERYAPSTPVTTSRAVARSARKHTRASDTETGDDTLATPTVATPGTSRRSTARKLRKSESIPSTEPEAFTPRVKTEPRDNDVFSDDNPFQSGSPSSWSHHKTRTTSRERKRKSSTLSIEASLRDERRSRKPETPVRLKQGDGVTVPAQSSFEFSLSSLRSPENEERDVIAGEEFTPEEQLAFESEHAELLYPLQGKVNRLQLKQGRASKTASWLVILSLLSAFGFWWRKEKIEIGYCGIGKPTWSLAETKVPDWANVLEPRCEPCPAHAFCYPDFEARCEHDFILKPHPLALGGLVPLPPTCEPDSEKARRVKAVADKAIEELRDRRAKWECGATKDGRKAIKSPEISELDLKSEVGKKRRKGMSDAEFDDLWKGALGEILGNDEIVSKTQQPSSVLTLTSTSVARLPLTCAFRRYLRLSLLAYRFPISILVLASSFLLYARSRVLAYRSDMARVPELVATTLDRLATQAALYSRGDAREPYIPIGQLRDDVLRSELKGSRREKLWKSVRSVVEENANIRAAVREGRGGDISRVWEWMGGIGGVSEIEGSARRRESSKVQFALSSGQEDHRVVDEGQTSSPRESRRWDEGRPIF
ncbi:inner nuclear membrane protein enriched at telomere/subtelomere region [Monascus purpureus]|uniref:Inner nuclear membrane protein enriched at telomere/subtelomere region n=1 Tax=Monascus purpureus TaxID=5098 RepID=A0A507QNT3_MONPU|nr:inner nuclear membrane protein enriched at telomere/subtelomere region [Monascus purpureus]BDD56754.1 hypothetical protein MAP00_002181 [Monascus purpureus]